MDPEIKQLLEENLRLSKENNQLLLKVRNVQKWAQITRIFYWIAIIGASFGALYYLKPYLGNLMNVYTGGISGSSSFSEMQDLLKTLSE